jgi:RNA polymerase sigma factor FliA
MTDSQEVLRLFHGHVDLVEIVAKQITRRVGGAVPLDDLRSFGREGLLKAARTFDESRGVPFRRWANVRVSGAILDGMRTWGYLPRRVYREMAAIAAADQMLSAYSEELSGIPSLSAEAADDRIGFYLQGLATAMAVGTLIGASTEIDDEGHSVSPEELLARAEFVDKVRAIVAGMPERERSLMERHYFGGQTLEEAAAAIGLSKSWGSRLHARAIEIITKALRRSGDL